MPVDNPVDPFKNAPHGTQAKDALAPSSDGSAIFVGYPDVVTVEAAAATVVSGSFDIEHDPTIVNGPPYKPAAGGTFYQLGTVGTSGFLRLERVRYPVLSATAAFTVHTGEVNVVTDTPAAGGLDS